MAPTASVSYRAGCGGGQVPVYDARRVLAGPAVVEILASPIKVAPARQSIFWINLWAEAPRHAHILDTGFLQHSIAPLFGKSNVLELHDK